MLGHGPDTVMLQRRREVFTPLGSITGHVPAATQPSAVCCAGDLGTLPEAWDPQMVSTSR